MMAHTTWGAHGKDFGGPAPCGTTLWAHTLWAHTLWAHTLSLLTLGVGSNS